MWYKNYMNSDSHWGRHNIIKLQLDNYGRTVCTLCHMTGTGYQMNTGRYCYDCAHTILEKRTDFVLISNEEEQKEVA